MQMLTFFSLGIQCNVEVQSEGEEGSIRKSVAKKETWQCLECDFFFFFFFMMIIMMMIIMIMIIMLMNKKK